jgi:hypothetical protein
MAIVATVTIALLLQYPYPYPRQPAPPPSNATIRGGANTQAVATFTGVFKAIEKNHLLIRMENGESMRMYITGSTKFIRDGKPAHAKDFQVDEPVTVDADRDLRMNLLAVRVEATPPPKPGDAKPQESKPKEK